MSNDEEPAPSAGLSENEDDEACPDEEQPSRTRKRCKTGLTIRNDVKLVQLVRALLILRSSVRFRQKLKKLRTQIFMDLRYIDPQARVLNYFYK